MIQRLTYMHGLCLMVSWCWKSSRHYVAVATINIKHQCQRLKRPHSRNGLFYSTFTFFLSQKKCHQFLCLIHTSIKAMTIWRKSCPIADNNLILVNFMCPHEWVTTVRSAVRIHVVNAVSSAAGLCAVTLLRIYPWNEWLTIQWKITTIKLENQSVCVR